MSAMTIESTRTRRVATAQQPTRVRPVRQTRPGPGRGIGPQARPQRPLAAPSLRAARPTQARSCVVAAPQPTTWRLTDRGIAAIMVVGLMIMVAAATVIGLTAFTVTSEDYRPAGQSAFIN